MPQNQSSNTWKAIVVSCIMTTLFLRVFEFRNKIITLKEEIQILQKENDSLRLNQKAPTVDYSTQKPCAGC